MVQWLKIIALILGLQTFFGVIALTQRIYNKAQEIAAGKIIYKPVVGRCNFEEFDIKPKKYADIKSKFCFVKEITVGSGPDETFISGNQLKGWNNTIYLTKSTSGSWNIAHETGIK